MSRRVLGGAVLLAMLAAGVAHADGPRKQTGPVDIHAVVQGMPRTGQVLAIEVTIAPRVGVSALSVNIVGNEGVAVRAADAARQYGALTAHASQTIELQVTPQAAGLQTVSVVADVGGITEGATRRTYTIELTVDGVGVVKSQARPAPVDATGQRIESLHSRPH